MSLKTISNTFELPLVGQPGVKFFTPCGVLRTWVVSDKYPSSKIFYGSPSTVYTEDMFVGYDPAECVQFHVDGGSFYLPSKK